MRLSTGIFLGAAIGWFLLSLRSDVIAEEAHNEAHNGSYDAALVRELAQAAVRDGNPARGAVLYAAPTSACLSCHKVGKHGGTVGPDLSQVGEKQKLEHIIESLLWPKRDVAQEYRAIAVLTADGQVIRGYKTAETDDQLELKNSSSGKPIVIAQDDIEDVRDAGTLMPDGLMATMSPQDRRDLVAFLIELGKHERLSLQAIDTLLAHSRGHHPATFDVPLQPLDKSIWPSWQSPVNRDRVYNFYAKQARHYRSQDPRPTLLAEFPGLDGGSYGHWGNQSDPTWADGRWNDTHLGSVLSGVFHGDKVTVARGVCIQIGTGDSTMSACFDPDTLSYARVWKGGFLRFTSVRHGFMQGLNQNGTTVDLPTVELPYDATLPKHYLGFYRHGARVIFSYRVGDTEYLDAATVVAGKFHRIVAPRNEHPDRKLLAGGDPQWPESILTQGELGTGTPYAVDNIPLPTGNPWNALLYCGGHDFMSDGSAVVCTMQGDVWRASGLTNDRELASVRWRRIASGLNQPLGVVVDDDEIFVIGRDQLTRLHDRNGDGETDFYECYSQSLVTSPGGHDFTCGLWRDKEDRFYTVSGKQGVMRIAADGKSSEVLATGLRNSDGLGLLPDGIVTIPSSEGDWMPASMVAAIRPGGPVLNRLTGTTPDSRGLPFFGRPGTNRTQPPELPMLYLPRGVDNSSGGQVHVDSDRWGPLSGQIVHFSFGAGTSFLLLRDHQGDWIQGAAVPLTGEFASGAHRGKFNPVDGQLYVSGMAGWGTYTTDDGCFARVRYTGGSQGGNQAQLPVGFHVHENGIVVSFAEPLDKKYAEQTAGHFAQAWNYRYSGAYGSPEYSSRQLGLRGHDVLTIQSATVLNDGRSVFLEIPEIQPVNQLHLLVQTSQEKSHDLFMTVHRLDAPMTEFGGYTPVEKVILPHPMIADLNRPRATARNPHRKALQNARAIKISAAKNLMFDTTRLKVRAGEPIRLTFENPDGVPHNWALLKPGTLESVGQLTNRMISDPDAAGRHYIPKTDDVIAYTDVVEPHSKFTIYFTAPKTPGRYPYLCTFPGHWMVMNGTMIVE